MRNRPGISGRHAELGKLAQAVDATAAGDPVFVLLVGEAGIGKTRLLHAAVELGQQRGLRTLVGSAIESGVSIPYLPLLAPLKTALVHDVADGASDTVRRMLDGDAEAGVPDAARAGQVLEAVYELLSPVPTVLVIDDVQWADASTVRLLDYLAHRADNARLAVFAAARNEPGLLGQTPIADGRRFVQLAVPPLTRDEVDDQIATLSGDHVPDPVLDAIYRRTGGNPLFVEEVVAASMAAGWDEAATSQPLRAFILHRVAGLSDAAQRAVEVLALLGRPADPRLLGAITRLSGGAVDRALDAAVRGGVAVPEHDGYALRHPLLAEVVAAALGNAAAMKLHRRIAEALERAGAEPAEIGLQWWRGGEAAKTWLYSMRAAEMAERKLAFAEALLHLERALESWPPHEGGREQCMLRAARSAWMTGDPGSALAHAQAAEAVGSSSSVDVLVAIGQYAWDAGERESAVEAFARAEVAATDETSPAVRARALWGVGRARVGEGRYTDAARLAASAAGLARSADDTAWEGEAWLLMGMSRAFQGDIEGVQEIEWGLRLASRAGDPGCTAHGYQFLVDLLGLAGRLDEAIDAALEGVEVCDRLGLARSHGSDLRGRCAWLMLERGRWAEVDRLLAPAEPRALPSLAQGLLAMRRGDWADADRSLAAAAVGGSIGGPGALGGLLELARVELAWIQGDHQGARSMLETVAVPPGVWGRDVSARVSWWKARLDPTIAVALVEHTDAVLGRAMNAEIRAWASSADLAGSVDMWTAAADAWAEARRPYDLVHLRLRQAEAAFASRDRVLARHALDAVVAGARELGARPLTVKAADLARRARVRLDARRRSDPDPGELTPREREVLTLLSGGLTNPQIAQHLFLSPKTVGIHVSRILQKLDAHTRGEAVATGRSAGILT